MRYTARTVERAARPTASAGARGTTRPRPGKQGASLARQIEDEIVAGRWPVGTVIGSETDLMAKHQVGRAVLREAVRLLEHHGIAAMRPGPGGGLIVAEPDAGAVRAALAVLLRFQGVTLEQLLEAKAALELSCVQLACGRLDEVGIERLRAAVAQEARTPPGHHTDIGPGNLHILVAELTGNPAMHIFVDVLTRLSVEHAQPLDPAFLDRVAGETYAAHAAIAEAIVAGDAAVARHLMLRHLAVVDASLPHGPASDGAQGRATAR